MENKTGMGRMFELAFMKRCSLGFIKNVRAFVRDL
jgi:hypothetical protein